MLITRLPTTSVNYQPFLWLSKCNQERNFSSKIGGSTTISEMITFPSIVEYFSNQLTMWCVLSSQCLKSKLVTMTIDTATLDSTQDKTMNWFIKPSPIMTMNSIAYIFNECNSNKFITWSTNCLINAKISNIWL